MLAFALLFKVTWWTSIEWIFKSAICLKEFDLTWQYDFIILQMYSYHMQYKHGHGSHTAGSREIFHRVHW